MKTLFLISFLSLAASAQTVITSISPTSGPDAGGTQVRITGDHLSPALICVLPCPTRVIFGDTSVDAQSESDKSLLVTTPPHEAGTVDVTVSVPGYDSVTAAHAFTFTPTAEAEYERILLPVYIDGTVAGANGTQWKTDFWLRNDGTETVSVSPWTCLGDVCGGVVPLSYPLAAQYALHNPQGLASAQRSNPSQLIYLFKTPEPHVSANLRVADVSRSELNAGTDIPVIREADLLTGRAELLNVPIDAAQSRALLRIYDVTSTDAQYAISLFPQTEEPGFTVTSVFVHATTPHTGQFRNEAAYAQVDLTALLHAVGNVRVEVTPLTPGSRFWAFASITNNETQLVTLVRP